jgi:hypothetical protein
MRLGDIEFYRHEVNNAPRVKYPPNIAAYSPALFRFVAPGDTISACPAIPNCNQSPIIGRVLEVASDSQQLNQLRNNCPIPIHPEVTEQQDKEISPFADQSYLLIQLYITSNQLSVLDESVALPNIFGEDVLRACHGLNHVASTNLTIWICTAQVTHFAPCIHVDDCDNQTYGALHGRAKCCYIQSSVTFTDNGEGAIVANTPLQHYDAFGPGTKVDQPLVITETEREVEERATVSRYSKKLLTKKGKIGGTSTQTIPMSRGGWESIRH